MRAIWNGTVLAESDQTVVVEGGTTSRPRVGLLRRLFGAPAGAGRS